MAYYHEENKAESLLRKELTRRKLHFRQSEMIAGREFDFYLPAFFLAIEVDGISHLSTPARQRDFTKEKTLAELGISLLRLGNQEVLRNPRACGDRIANYIAVWTKNSRAARATAIETPLQAGLRAWAAKTGIGPFDIENSRPKRE